LHFEQANISQDSHLITQMRTLYAAAPGNIRKILTAAYPDLKLTPDANKKLASGWINAIILTA
jgi:hypothetical protein